MNTWRRDLREGFCLYWRSVRFLFPGSVHQVPLAASNSEKGGKWDNGQTAQTTKSLKNTHRKDGLQGDADWFHGIYSRVQFDATDVAFETFDVREMEGL